MQNVNRVILTGNLTRDPELRNTGGGTAVCGLRLAVNGRRKNSSTGQWEDAPNFFDVTCFGAQAENCHKYLAKGRALAVDGRLDWREWTTDSGEKRQAVQVIAETIQFLSGPEDRGSGSSSSQSQSDIPIDTSDLAAAPATAADDDIPF